MAVVRHVKSMKEWIGRVKSMKNTRLYWSCSEKDGNCTEGVEEEDKREVEGW